MNWIPMEFRENFIIAFKKDLSFVTENIWVLTQLADKSNGKINLSYPHI